MHFKEDFGIDGEVFFATGHGKGAGDGLGRTAKRLTKRYSLQFDGYRGVVIQTPHAMFEWCNTNIDNIKCFFFFSKEECDENFKSKLEERFKLAKTVDGTQGYHAFVPVDQHRIEVKVIASDESGDV